MSVSYFSEVISVLEDIDRGEYSESRVREKLRGEIDRKYQVGKTTVEVIDEGDRLYVKTSGRKPHSLGLQHVDSVFLFEGYSIDELTYVLKQSTRNKIDVKEINK